MQPLRTIERYLGRQIYAAVGFVLLGFLALFAFFDLIKELADLGRGDYQLRQVFAFVALTFVIGEWIAPLAEETAQKVKLRALSSMIGQDLQSGLWFKDEGSFINVREARDPKVLQGLRIFEFDAEYRLRKITFAERAEYRAKGVWQLHDVVATVF